MLLVPLLLLALSGPDDGPVPSATPVVAPAPLLPPEVGDLFASRSPRLRLERGRATLVDESGLTPLFAPIERQRLAAAGHLEVGALSELDLAWSGHGSVHMIGPGALEWTSAPFLEGGSIELFDFRQADLEVRTGRLLLALPGGLQLELRRGAVQLFAHSSGRYEIRHLGGEAARVLTPGLWRVEESTLGSGAVLQVDAGELLERTELRVARAAAERAEAEELALAEAEQFAPTVAEELAVGVDVGPPASLEQPGPLVLLGYPVQPEQPEPPAPADLPEPAAGTDVPTDPQASPWSPWGFPPPPPGTELFESSTEVLAAAQEPVAIVPVLEPALEPTIIDPVVLIPPIEPRFPSEPDQVDEPAVDGPVVPAELPVSARVRDETLAAATELPAEPRQPARLVLLGLVLPLGATPPGADRPLRLQHMLRLTPAAEGEQPQRVLELHGMVRTIAGPLGPLPMVLPFLVWPTPARPSLTPPASPVSPAPSGPSSPEQREFTLSDLLNGRVAY